MRQDPPFLAFRICDLARLAGVDYDTARQFIMAGMEVHEASRWIWWGRKHGKASSEIIEIWRQRRQLQRRRHWR